MAVNAHRFRTSLQVVPSSTKRQQLFDTVSLWIGYYGVALVWMTDLFSLRLVSSNSGSSNHHVCSNGVGSSVWHWTFNCISCSFSCREAIRCSLCRRSMSSLAMGPVDSYLVDTVRGPLLLIAAVEF